MKPGARVLATLASAVALLVVPWPGAWVEAIFGRGLMVASSHLLAPTVGRVPWSVSGILLALAAVALAAALASRAGRSALRRRLPGILVGLLLSFSLVWGLGYRRAPLAQLLALPPGAPDAADVRAAADTLIGVLRETASASPGPSEAATSEARAAACIAAEVRRLGGANVAVPPIAKPLPPGSLLALGFGGVTSPWLLEPHVDAALPPAARLATAAHEMAHAAGFAREADTDALAVLAGLRCGDAGVRYAVALHAVSGLLAGTPRPQRDALAARLPQRARADLEALAVAARRYRSDWASRAATRVYDAYLKGRGVRAGMADYDRATDLVVRALAAGAPAR